MTVTIFPPKFQSWLTGFLEEQKASAGTVHLHIRDKLSLAAAVDVPIKVRRTLAKLPRGKGLAGLALEREEPVQTCQLEEAASGVQGGEGSVAVPIRGKDGGVRAVVALAFDEERELSQEELEALSVAATTLPFF